MAKAKDKTYSVTYVGNADKRNGSSVITRRGGASIKLGKKGELTETEINNLRTAGLILDVGAEVKEKAGIAASSGTSSSSSSSGSSGS